MHSNLCQWQCVIPPPMRGENKDYIYRISGRETPPSSPPLLQSPTHQDQQYLVMFNHLRAKQKSSNNQRMAKNKKIWKLETKQKQCYFLGEHCSKFHAKISQPIEGPGKFLPGAHRVDCTGYYDRVTPLSRSHFAVLNNCVTLCCPPSLCWAKNILKMLRYCTNYFASSCHTVQYNS